MKFRNFIFTLNNYTEEDVNNLLTKLPFQYIVFAKEVAPTTGTPHLQGYCELHGQLDLQQIKALTNETIHCEPRRASQHRAIAYIKDPESIPEFASKKQNPLPDMLYERGNPKQQGARNDLIIARHLLNTGRTLDVNDPDFTIGVQKAYEAIQKYVPYPGNYSKPRVVWHYGESGSGKTQRAYEISSGSIYKCDLLRYGWLDGYNGHETVIIDDLVVDDKNRQFWFDQLLLMTDKYLSRMNVKQSSVQFRPKLIIITSQHPPYEMFGEYPALGKNDPTLWAKDEQLRQLMRRIDQLVHCELAEEEELKFPETIKHITHTQKFQG